MKHIAIALERTMKDCRDKITGITSYACKCPDWEVHIIPEHLGNSRTERILGELRPDGIIFEGERFAIRRKYPSIAIDTFLSGTPNGVDACINCDDAAIGRTAAELMSRRQFRNFACVGPDWHFEQAHAVARFEAFESRAMELGGMFCGRFLVKRETDLATRTFSLHINDWLSRLPSPCAVFVYMDFLTLPLTVAAKRVKLNIPSQIGIISVDNEATICENAAPTISSIEPDFVRAGFRSAELLDRFMRTGKPKNPRIEQYGIKAVHERMSSRNTAGQFHLVAQIQEAIRVSATEGVRVSDLARKFNLSTRMLEYHFRNSIGCSIRDEILRTRLSNVKQLLEDSSVPIGEIPSRTGFGTSANLQSVFRRHTGSSLRDWRKAALEKSKSGQETPS